MDIPKIQEYLAEKKLDGWLMADFHARNDIAIEMMQLTGMLTRRSFYFIPAIGEPVGLVNAIEKSKFENVPGKIMPYLGYRHLEKELKSLLKGYSRVAMEYSPKGRLPYIGLVDYGTIDLVQSFDVEIVSSADLVANFLARLTPEQIAAHRIIHQIYQVLICGGKVQRHNKKFSLYLVSIIMAPNQTMIQRQQIWLTRFLTGGEPT